MSLPPQLRPRAKIKGTKTSSISVFIAQSLNWPDRTTRSIPLDSQRVGPSSWLTWPGARRPRIGFRAEVIFFKIGAGMTYTVELILMSSFQKYIHFPILDVPPRKNPLSAKIFEMVESLTMLSWIVRVFQILNRNIMNNLNKSKTSFVKITKNFA
jgi:hypothetical protein